MKKFLRTTALWGMWTFISATLGAVIGFVAGGTTYAWAVGHVSEPSRKRPQTQTGPGGEKRSGVRYGDPGAGRPPQN